MSQSINLYSKIKDPLTAQVALMDLHTRLRVKAQGRELSVEQKEFLDILMAVIDFMEDGVYGPELQRQRAEKYFGKMMGMVRRLEELEAENNKLKENIGG